MKKHRTRRKRFAAGGLSLALILGMLGMPSLSAEGGYDGGNTGRPGWEFQLDPIVFGLPLIKLVNTPPIDLPEPPPRPEPGPMPPVGAPGPNDFLPPSEETQLDPVDKVSNLSEMHLSFQVEEVPREASGDYDIGKRYLNQGVLLENANEQNSLELVGGKLVTSPTALSSFVMSATDSLWKHNPNLQRMYQRYIELLQQLGEWKVTQRHRETALSPEDEQRETEKYQELERERQQVEEDIVISILFWHGGKIESSDHNVVLVTRELTPEELANPAEKTIREENGWKEFMTRDGKRMGMFLYQNGVERKIHLEYPFQQIMGYGGDIFYSIFLPKGQYRLSEAGEINLFGAVPDENQKIVTFVRSVATGKDLQRFLDKIKTEGHSMERGKIYRFLVKEAKSKVEGAEGYELEDLTKVVILDLLCTGSDFRPYAFSTAKEADDYWKSLRYPADRMEDFYIPCQQDTAQYTNRLQKIRPKPPQPDPQPKPTSPVKVEKKDRVPNTGATM